MLSLYVKKCVICKSGDVVPKKRQNEKECFVIYGWNGARTATHVESRCNFSNSNFECGAGYLTYKGTRIMDDIALKTGFDLDYLVEYISCVHIQQCNPRRCC